MLGFAKDNLHLSESELSRLSSDIREGDMSVLLKEYEKEIKVNALYKPYFTLCLYKYINRIH